MSKKGLNGSTPDSLLIHTLHCLSSANEENAVVNSACDNNRVVVCAHKVLLPLLFLFIVWFGAALSVVMTLLQKSDVLPGWAIAVFSVIRGTALLMWCWMLWSLVELSVAALSVRYWRRLTINTDEISAWTQPAEYEAIPIRVNDGRVISIQS